ncbi:alcohol dehydrogenase catalytic domain-containing protein [Sulfobacillus harzensis]|uniref:Alcohol dehydrogenase catalytic domain-containing protein n=1 Tax=Sulfobacillus harzensis TaxID=2729629 RepID=A0A7Y0L7P9_9FIRM|nr:alcohol dehydrogenase catalytic domain-containing protein [Sulfobacillus harzensis]NMP24852.1 alcohol dehydrogenase catalytic domain-containing protein [Sulfobacillus harzensis]
MKAAQFWDLETVRIGDVAPPTIQDLDDVVVRVTTAAICGSDLHLYRGDIPGIKPGTVLGHEYVGRVEAVGPRVKTVQVGDRVVGTFHVACGLCSLCRLGQFHQCQRGGVLGYGMAFGDYPGAQAEWVRVPWGDVNLRRIPDAMADDSALFAGDIFTTAYGAVKNANLAPGESVAVIGAGPVGLMAVMAAQTLGAGVVYSIDRDTVRAEQASAFGARPVPSDRTNPVRRILKDTGGLGVDVVIEAVGGPTTLSLAFQLVRGGGRVSALGVTAEAHWDYPLMTALTRDISFRVGLANIHRDIDEVLRLLASGRVDPTQVISHRLPLEDAAEGYRLFHQQMATKVVLEVG